MRNIKRIIITALGIAFILCMLDVEYVPDTSAKNIIRLHVIANSNSSSDQAQKLTVRDAVLNEYSHILSQAESKAQAERLIEENLEAIKNTASVAAGEKINVSAQYVNTYIPQRTYADITYPAGYYDALRIVIGEGEGENWWCVMFPPMCLDDNTDSNEENNIFTRPKIKIRLKIVEFIKRIFKI
ncbi:MAG: stage II sporulation protein R [Clostridiales bacterium]|nr:stage II sporulation protein R [Clostridiales bacterium]